MLLATATIDDRNLDGWWTRVYISNMLVNDRSQENFKLVRTQVAWQA